MPLARVGARTDSTTSYSYKARCGQLPRTRIGIVRRTRARHAVCAEGLHFSAFHYTDVFQQGVCGEYQNLQDAGLIELASSLPNVALRDRAPATVRQYSGAFCQLEKWMSAKGVGSIPIFCQHIIPQLPYSKVLHGIYSSHGADGTCIALGSLYFNSG